MNDIEIKSVDKAQTYYGHVMKYARFSEDYKHAGSVSLEFINDKYEAILKAVSLWVSYIQLITKSDVIKPTTTHEQNGILDYCGSLYYLVTWMDRRRLIYWEKLTGIYPRTVPMSIHSFNNAPIVEDKITVDFEYGIRSEPNDPDVLFDLNMLSCRSASEAISVFNAGQESKVKPTVGGSGYKLLNEGRGPNANGDVFASAPYQIYKKRDTEHRLKGQRIIGFYRGRVVYYLNWK